MMPTKRSKSIKPKKPYPTSPYTATEWAVVQEDPGPGPFLRRLSRPQSRSRAVYPAGGGLARGSKAPTLSGRRPDVEGCRQSLFGWPARESQARPDHTRPWPSLFNVLDFLASMRGSRFGKEAEYRASLINELQGLLECEAPIGTTWCEQPAILRISATTMPSTSFATHSMMNSNSTPSPRVLASKLGSVGRNFRSSRRPLR